MILSNIDLLMKFIITLCRKASDSFIKLRKDRDYHRMHHKRIVQEKNKLVDDIKKWVSKDPLQTLWILIWDNSSVIKIMNFDCLIFNHFDSSIIQKLRN